MYYKTPETTKKMKDCKILHDESYGPNSRVGLRNFALAPRSFTPVYDAEFKPEFFRNRLGGTINWIESFIIGGIIVGERIKMALAPVLPSFSFFEYHRAASATFTDMPLDLLGPFPRTNDNKMDKVTQHKLQLFDYGAYCPTAKPLTGELLEFVSDPKSKGTILIAFGNFFSIKSTVINWDRAPKEKFEAILETMNSLTDYRIIWAYNGRAIKMKPHIYVSNWVPQIDVLFDNRTDAGETISAGPSPSLKEAACASVPSVFMPMFAEQARNGWLAKDKGYAEVFNKHVLSAENLKATMKRVLENKR
ncbi:hypothetical protein TELCIR_00220 [Teladorsagia circumcincta]|uniref:glucuronosyltransferase n=1 Tax=Teladorsagia circumcincta TaxID=45464 RepID=A0A2G9V583_TELCI|nr:hypothetical protein TELCIR_00220 [Teladorsagia circumcincta]